MARIKLYNEETSKRKWLFAAVLHEILGRQYPDALIFDTSNEEISKGFPFALQGTEHLVYYNDEPLVYSRTYLAVSTSPESGIHKRLNRFVKIGMLAKAYSIKRMIFTLAIECPRGCLGKVEEVSDILGNRGIQFELWEAKDFRRQIQVQLGIACPAFGLQHLLRLKAQRKLSCTFAELVNQQKAAVQRAKKTEPNDTKDEPLENLFISYASEDRAFVEQLIKKLDQYAAHVWYDQREILVGDSIVAKINAGLNRATVIVAILSKSSIGRPWVLREVYSSLGRQLQSAKVSVLPVVIDDCDIPPLLNDVKYADFRNSFDTGFNQLISALQGRRQRLYL